MRLGVEVLLQLALVVEREPVLVVEQSGRQEGSHRHRAAQMVPGTHDLGGLMVRMVMVQVVVLVVQVMVVVEVMVMVVGRMVVRMGVRYAVVMQLMVMVVVGCGGGGRIGLGMAEDVGDGEGFDAVCAGPGDGAVGTGPHS